MQLASCLGILPVKLLWPEIWSVFRLTRFATLPESLPVSWLWLRLSRSRFTSVKSSVGIEPPNPLSERSRCFNSVSRAICFGIGSYIQTSPSALPSSARVRPYLLCLRTRVSSWTWEKKEEGRFLPPWEELVKFTLLKDLLRVLEGGEEDEEGEEEEDDEEDDEEDEEED